MISDEQIHVTIDYDLFLELILLHIRGETIRYASHKKKQTVEIEKKLISEINALEQENLSDNIHILDKTKLELENIRGETISDHQICSRIQWLGDGEKPSKYFYS